MTKPVPEVTRCAVVGPTSVRLAFRDGWAGIYYAFQRMLAEILLALYLIVDSLLGFGLNLGPAIFLLYLLGLVAGAFILFGALAKSA